MSNESNPSVLAKPLLVISVGRASLSFVRRLLPERGYRAVYDTVFAAYRWSLRATYRRHAISAAIAQDVPARARAQAVHQAMQYSLVGTPGLEATFDAVRDIQARNVDGCMVELGVAEGGCASLIRTAANLSGAQRHLWLFDSYEGLPEPTAQDLVDGATGHHIRPLPKGSCLGTYESVSEMLFDEMRFDRSSITMVKGWFDHTVPATRSQLGRIALLRIDADWYESVKTCLDGLYDLVVPGGYTIIDDYGTCFGARRAVDEFLAAHGIEVTLVHDGRGGCHWLKPA